MPKTLVGLVLSFHRPYWKWIALSVTFLGVVEFSALQFPSIIGQIMAALFEWPQTAGFVQHKIYVLVFWALVALVFNWAKDQTEIKTVDFDMPNYTSTQTFMHWLGLSFAQIRGQNSGYVQSSVSDGENAARGLVHTMLYSILPALMTAVFSCAISIYLNVVVGLAITALVLFFAAYSYVLNRVYYKRIQKADASIRKQGKFKGELFRNAGFIKFSGLEELSLTQYSARMGAVAQERKDLWSSFGHWTLPRNLMWRLGPAIVVPLSVWQLSRGKIQVADCMSAYMYGALAFSAVGNFGPLQRQMTEQWISLKNLLKIIQLSENEPVQTVVKRPLRKPEGVEIIFRNTTFAYPPTQRLDDSEQEGEEAGEAEVKNALKDVSLHIHPGQFVGVVGASGHGKTTFLHLLLGLYRATSGQILVNGIDITELDPRWFKAQVGYVSQEITLFDQSIRDNLLLQPFGDHSATRVPDEELLDLLAMVGLKEFVESLPQGLDTIVGERGTRLSGGQRQRLAIVQALVRSPGLLILDEATAQLDALSEAQVQSTIANSRTGMTVVAVAHRLSTLVEADQIIVLCNGEIEAIGTHEYLLQHSRTYRQMATGLRMVSVN